MTNRIKTVQKPRILLIDCNNAKKISEIVSDILNYCSYNTIINSFRENTDFIILTDGKLFLDGSKFIADTVMFDKTSVLSDNEIHRFRNCVTSYEYCLEKYGDNFQGIMTYSSENYDAKLMSRNINIDGNITSFDIIHDGILIRAKIQNNLYSLEDVLICTCTLAATGIPIAAILRYFNSSAEK